VDPSIAALLSTLISAVSTAILMFAAYHWPAGRNESDDRKPKRKGKHAADDEETP
jgi:hypothetical protein